MKLLIALPLSLLLLLLFPASAICQGVDIPAALALAADGSRYVAGSGMNSAGRMDLLLLGFDPAGTFLGASRILAGASGSGFGRALLLAQDTTILVSGMVPNPATGQYELVTAAFPRSALTGISSPPDLPGDVALSQNYPNPLSGHSRIAAITYAIGRADGVRLSVSNEEGETVALLIDGWREAGTYQAQFDTSTLPAGAYYYTLRVHGGAVTKKLLILR